MARFIALTDGLVGTHYVRAGQEFDFDGPAPAWARSALSAPAKQKAAPAKQKAAPVKQKAGD